MTFIQWVSSWFVCLSLQDLRIVSSAAVIRVITQRFSPTNVSRGETLRDEPNNGRRNLPALRYSPLFAVVSIKILRWRQA